MNCYADLRRIFQSAKDNNPNNVSKCLAWKHGSNLTKIFDKMDPRPARYVKIIYFCNNVSHWQNMLTT